MLIETKHATYTPCPAKTHASVLVCLSTSRVACAFLVSCNVCRAADWTTLPRHGDVVHAPGRLPVSEYEQPDAASSSVHKLLIFYLSLYLQHRLHVCTYLCMFVCRLPVTGSSGLSRTGSPLKSAAHASKTRTVRTFPTCHKDVTMVVRSSRACLGQGGVTGNRQTDVSGWSGWIKSSRRMNVASHSVYYVRK